eukprot:TRINITY_DN48529_c0_g1_i1.p1 TRINITY_DN48529_c0_g1~~TRINITY_DN48529_c0_g1_i1.p1  ORF type:complete len:1145 (-),score=213.11 TRINITY_DN48529_c0_g1_i1:157-3303(-)
MDATLLYQPLCEVVWRVVGHIFHAMIELQENQHLPVPQLALGQVKMLLQTNEELSRQLKEARRAYLRELALLRERDRKRSTTVQKAIDSLQEDPVMFYEPLSYVLDETTKDFVREVVEERLKLEMRRADTVPEETHEDEDTNDLAEEMKHLQAENSKLRNTAARETDRANRLEQLEARCRDEVAREKKTNLELQTQLEEALAEIERLRAQPGAPAPAPPPQKIERQVGQKPSRDDHQKELNELRNAYEAQVAEIEELKNRLAQLQREKEEQAKELAKLNEALSAGEAERARLLSNKKVEHKVVQEEKVEIQVVTDDTELKNQLEKHMAIEKELRATIQSLEKALEEAMSKPPPPRAPKKVVKAAPEPEVPIKKPKKPTGYSEEEMKEAILKAQEKLMSKIEEYEAEIDRLTIELEEAKKKIFEYEQEAKARKLAAGADQDEAMQAYKWKQKYEEILEKYTALVQAHEALEEKVLLLIEKLRKYGGDAAVNETLAEIKLVPPPGKKARKKKAWERLWDDALRRAGEMRSRLEKIKREEERHLRALTRAFADRGASAQFQLDALNHLHKAQEAAYLRYHEALSRFHDRNADVLATVVEPLSESDHDESGFCPTCGRGRQSNSRNGALSSPGGMAIETRRVVGSRLANAFRSGQAPGSFENAVHLNQPGVSSPGDQPSIERSEASDLMAHAIMMLVDQQCVNGQATVTELEAFLGVGTIGGRYCGGFLDWLMADRKRNFRHFDADHDGTISREELQEAVATFLSEGGVCAGTPHRLSARNVRNAHEQTDGYAGDLLQLPLKQSIEGGRESLQMALTQDTLTRRAREARHTPPSGWHRPGSPANINHGVGSDAGEAHVLRRVLSVGASDSVPQRKSGNSGSPRRDMSVASMTSGQAEAGLEDFCGSGRALRGSPRADRKIVSRRKTELLSAEHKLPATFNGGAGRPGLGVAQARSQSETLQHSRTMPSLPAAGREILAVTREGGSGFDRSQQRRTPPTTNPVAGLDIPGTKFFVTPLVSQQSMEAGILPPMSRPRTGTIGSGKGKANVESVT